MKNIILFLLISLFVFPFGMNAQQINQESKKSLYERKVITYTKMRNTGVHLTFGGALLATGGIALMMNGLNQMDRYDSNTNQFTNDGDGKFFLGYAAFLIGGSAATGGIVFWAIGGSKKKSYLRKLNSLSFNLNPGPGQTFSLAYKF